MTFGEDKDKKKEEKVEKVNEPIDLTSNKLQKVCAADFANMTLKALEEIDY